MIEWKAAEYADIAGLQRWLADSSLAAISLAGDENVLDVGCGDGRVTADIAARVPRGRVTGVDVSHDMIDFAQRTHALPNVTFFLCDAREVSAMAPGGPYDLIVSFNALHWLQEQEQVLSDFHGLLRPDGRAFIQMVGHGQRKSLEHVIRETCLAAPWSEWLAAYADPYRHVRPASYDEMARRAGFEAAVSMEACAWDFETREAFAKWAQATFVYWTSHLPAERCDGFIEDVLDRYRSLSDGSERDANVFHFYQLKASLVRPG